MDIGTVWSKTGGVENKERKRDAEEQVLVVPIPDGFEDLDNL